MEEQSFTELSNGENNSNLEGDELWYLSYGSNMSPTVLLKRRKVFPERSLPCTVPGYTLKFNIIGMPYFEPAFGSIVKIKDELLEPVANGVIHRITQEDFEMVKRTEGGGGYPRLGYNVAKIKVITYTGEEIEASTLVGDESIIRDDIQPSSRYLSLVIGGAKFHGLNPSYLLYLRSLSYFEISSKRKRLGKYLFTLLVVLAMAPALPFFIYARLTEKHPPRFVFRFIHWLMRVFVRFHDGYWSAIFGSGFIRDGR